MQGHQGTLAQGLASPLDASRRQEAPEAALGLEGTDGEGSLLVEEPVGHTRLELLPELLAPRAFPSARAKK